MTLNFSFEHTSIAVTLWKNWNNAWKKIFWDPCTSLGHLRISQYIPRTFLEHSLCIPVLPWICYVCLTYFPVFPLASSYFPVHHLDILDFVSLPPSCSNQQFWLTHLVISKDQESLSINARNTRLNSFITYFLCLKKIFNKIIQKKSIWFVM